MSHGHRLSFSRCVSTSDGAASEKAVSSETMVHKPIPLLQSPLGVPQPPTTAAKIWTERRNDLLNKDMIMHSGNICQFFCMCTQPICCLERNVDRLKEASKGYFQDLNAMRRHGGKTWIATTVMIHKDVCSLMNSFFSWLIGEVESTLFS
jgi:hypothetical protein